MSPVVDVRDLTVSDQVGAGSDGSNDEKNSALSIPGGPFLGSTC